MQYITFTELRTKAAQLVKALKSGQTVKLTYRSQPLADIEPTTQSQVKPTDVAKLEALIKSFPFPRLTVPQARAKYRRHLTQKYGNNISGR